tara:strand:- start:879 stop:1598 length:720 start_codon:yes stop_codon:yes gene_type:complete
MADFNHVDYTAELNRIIVALTGIRDDVRLLRRRVEDPNLGVTTNAVMNDFQKAILALSMSDQGAGNAEQIRQTIASGNEINGVGATTTATGDDANSDPSADRSSILTALGQDPASTKVLIRVAGIYYWEADATAGVDGGVYGSIPQVIQYALGAQIGYHALAGNAPTPGSPPTPEAVNPTATKKRWPAPRPEGQTALQIPNKDADLINPVTGEIIAKTLAQQIADAASGSTPPPASGPR